MPSVVREFVLIGAYKGRTIQLGQFPFTRGVMRYEGEGGLPLASLKRVLASYQAFARGPDLVAAKVAFAEARGEEYVPDEQDDPTPQAVESQVRSDGGTSEGPADDGSGHDDPEGAGSGGQTTDEGGQSPPPDRQTKIRLAISALDADDDETWMNDGTGRPKVNKVREVSGIDDVTRAEIEQANPGYNRAAAKALMGDVE